MLTQMLWQQKLKPKPQKQQKKDYIVSTNMPTKYAHESGERQKCLECTSEIRIIQERTLFKHRLQHNGNFDIAERIGYTLLLYVHRQHQLHSVLIVLQSNVYEEEKQPGHMHKMKLAQYPKRLIVVSSSSKSILQKLIR